MSNRKTIIVNRDNMLYYFKKEKLKNIHAYMFNYSIQDVWKSKYVVFTGPEVENKFIVLKSANPDFKKGEILDNIDVLSRKKRQANE